MSLSWFVRRENQIAIALVVLVLGLHFIVINNPHAQILDEQHYVKSARSIVHDREQLQDGYADVLRPEHPPLGKLIIAGGIEIFGDNSFGWRFFPVIFGTASIMLFYLICQKLTRRRWVPLIATSLFAFENASFVQAGVAMLDVFMVTFILAAFLLFLHERYISSGVMLALSSLVKLSAAFAGIVIVLYWLIMRRKPIKAPIMFILSAPAAFMALMPAADYVTTSQFFNPWDRVRYMTDIMQTLTFESLHSGNASKPWSWVLSPNAMAYWFDPSYYSGINWTLWALIIPVMLYALYVSVRLLIPRRKALMPAAYSPVGMEPIGMSVMPGDMGYASSADPPADDPPEPVQARAASEKKDSPLLFAFLWFLATYIVWYPVLFFTDRIMFRFYFYPTVGAICLAVGYFIGQLLDFSTRLGPKARWSIRAFIGVWMIANFVVFLFMGPLM